MKKICLLIVCLVVFSMSLDMAGATIGDICEGTAIVNCEEEHHKCFGTILTHYPKEVCKPGGGWLLPINRCAYEEGEQPVSEDCSREGKTCSNVFPVCIDPNPGSSTGAKSAEGGICGDLGTCEKACAIPHRGSHECEEGLRCCLEPLDEGVPEGAAAEDGREKCGDNNEGNCYPAPSCDRLPHNKIYMSVEDTASVCLPGVCCKDKPLPSPREGCGEGGYCYQVSCDLLPHGEIYKHIQDGCSPGLSCCKAVPLPGAECGIGGNCYNFVDDCSSINAVNEDDTEVACAAGQTCCKSRGSPTDIITPSGSGVLCGEGGKCYDNCEELENYELLPEGDEECVEDTELCCKEVVEEGADGENGLGPDVTPPPLACINDCGADGQRECTGETTYQVCGLDADGCLKWVETGTCQEFYVCDAGDCVASCIDVDGDGYGEGPACSEVDCDDTNAEINPGAAELCNGIDDNCNDEVDEGIADSHSWDPCDEEAGCCPQETDCLVDADGIFNNNYKPEKYYANQKPRCISSGQYIGDHLCQQGEWISRTGAIASQLVEHASDYEEYSLFCGAYDYVLNNFEFLIGNEFVDEKYMTECDINNVDVPCVNNFCVLAFEEGVVSGVSLNLPLNENNFLEAMQYDGNCDNALGTTDGQFNPCSNKEVWFNAQHNSIIFSDEDANLRATNFLEAFVEFLENPIESLLEIFGLRTKAKAEITASQVYILEGNKSIKATMERVCMAAFETAVVVSYSDISVDMCAEVNDLFPGACIEENNKYYVLADDTEDLFKYWNDLTAKLRIN